MTARDRRHALLSVAVLLLFAAAWLAVQYAT